MTHTFSDATLPICAGFRPEGVMRKLRLSELLWDTMEKAGFKPLMTTSARELW